MNGELAFADIEKQITPEEVTNRCTEYTFGGTKLSPFTKRRQLAARCMGNLLFLGRAQPDENGTYPELFMDALMVLWLCCVDEPRVRRACMNREQAIEDMLGWWDKSGGDIGSAQEAEAIDVFKNIIEDLQTVSAEVDATGTGGGSDVLGES